MSYVTLAEFKAAITIADTVDDTDLQRALDAASSWIDYYTGRTFEAVGITAEAMYFLPNEVDRLSVPDLSSVSELAIDTVGDESFDVVLEPDDYDLLPLNLVPDQGGYTEIRLKATSPSWFIVGYQVRVTAIWGFGTVPAAVQQACILIANRYFHRLSVPFSMWESPQTGELATLIDRDWDVINLLSPYMTSGSAGRGAGAAWVLV
jgi:hypothetical protein